MPTEAELSWLLNNCTWTWTTRGGNNGYLVTSTVSDYTSNSIFLPAAGYSWGDGGREYVGTNSIYWSSSYSHEISGCARDLSFKYYYEMNNERRIGNCGRYYGCSVRAVLSK